MADIHFVDGTLREGEQTPGVFFTLEEKLAIARALDRAGVAILDAGMPAVSEDEQKALAAIAKLDLSASIGVSVRLSRTEIDLALECGADEIFLICPVSPSHLRYKLNMTEAELRREMERHIRYAAGKGLMVNLVAEDGTRGEPDFLGDLVTHAARCGAGRLFLCDTVGIADPFMIKRQVEDLRQAVGGRVAIGVHCHNDLGMATANTLAAIAAGADYPAVTVNGIGERAGNAALHEVAIAAQKNIGRSSGMDLTRMMELSALVEVSSGILIPPHAPIVGFNAFRHESGIHVDGLLKNGATYTGVKPETAGRKMSFVLGKHTGAGTIRHLLEKEKITADDGQVREILRRIKQQRSHKNKKEIAAMIQAVHRFHESSLNFPRQAFIDIVNEVIENSA